MRAWGSYLVQDKMIEGKEAVVRMGAYRGMRGRIKSATATHVQMELEAQVRLAAPPSTAAAACLPPLGLLPRAPPQGPGAAAVSRKC